ncbi:MAG: ATP-binding protein [Actinomycetota bacterium]|nr:ATP-binding protein [Actinomycetota bacterium]
MRLRGSLKSRLAIWIGVAIVSTGIVVLLFGFFIARSAIRTQVLEKLGNVLIRTENSICIACSNADSITSYLASKPEVVGAVELFKRVPKYEEYEGTIDVLEKASEVHKNIIGYSIYSSDGEKIVFRGIEDSENNYISRDDFSRALEALSKGKKFFDFSSRNGNLSLTCASAIRENTGELAGILFITTSASGHGRPVVEAVGLGEQGSIELSMASKDKIKVVSVKTSASSGEQTNQSKRKVEVRYLSANSDLPQIKAATGEKGECEVENQEGLKFVVSYESIQNLGWGISVFTPAETAFMGISRLRNISILVIVVLFAGGLALANLLARSMAGPIEELQRAVQAVASGKLSTRVSIKGGVEVTALAEEFNKMAERLDGLYEELERKVAERTRELEEANERLSELDRLKSEFVSIVSHELRSPMASMKMGISAVLSELVGPLNDEQKEMLDVASRSIDRLAKLTTDLLDLTKIDAGQLKLEIDECDIRELVEEVVEAEKFHARDAGLDLKVQCDKGEITILCDRDRIFQVIQNLINNAIKFTEKGIVNVMVSSDDKQVTVCVEDTGPGIPEDSIKTIFESFSRAYAESASEKKGAGLGLAICRGIIEAHGGKIWAESRVGKGSKFCFSLYR